MRIRVKTFASIAGLIGKREIEVELKGGATIYDLFQALYRKLGVRVKDEIWDSERDAPQAYIKVMLNGRDIDFIQGINTKLSDGQTVAIFPPVAGGE